jgi:subtilisin family serine protease
LFAIPAVRCLVLSIHEAAILMTRTSTRAWLVLVALVAFAFPAHAEHDKLNPSLRIALACLRQGAVPEKLRRDGVSVTRAGELDVFITGTASRAQLEAAGAHVRTALPGVFTATIPVWAIARVAALPGVTRIQGAAQLEPELNASVPTTTIDLQRGPAPDFSGLNGQGVVIGEVDRGVDYGHGDFLDEAGHTRFLGIWDQIDGTGPAPDGYSYGTECTQAQIETGTCAEIDDDANGHGTHVLGIAAGDGSQTGGGIPAFTYAGMAPRADLMAVRTGFTDTGLLDGVVWLFARATALGKNAVVNISYGSHDGPHDGTSPLETGLSALVGPGRLIVKSAGNERGQARHAEVSATVEGADAHFVVTGPTDRQIQFVGYYDATEVLDVTIVTPDSQVIGPIGIGAKNAEYPGDSTSNGQVYVENGVSLTTTGARELWLEINGETECNGDWTVRFTPVALGVANGEVDLWRLRASNGSTARFQAPAMTDEKLVSEPGNAENLITVGAYVTKNIWISCGGGFIHDDEPPSPLGSLASFSSPGPTRDGRAKPDLVAPGASIASATTFDFTRACDTPRLLNDDRNHYILSGTSMAAPHVTGAIAVLMQKYGAITPAFAKNYLAAHALVDNFTGTPWNPDWGNGKLRLGDLTDPVAQVLGPNTATDTLAAGDVRDLTWSASDTYGGVTSVDLFLSRDDGQTWVPIAAEVPNTGSYPWTVTGPATAQARLRVMAHDAAGNLGADVSDSAWVITEPQLVGVEPSTGSGAFALFAAPNPTRGPLAVEFLVGRDSEVQLTVHDVMGRELARLASGRFVAGRHRTAWDARGVPSGLYFVRYQAPGFLRIARIAVTR